MKDITILTALPKLRNVAFSDPAYGAKSPVASMANYHVHILYHLPQLEYIDGLHISTRQVAEQAEVREIHQMISKKDTCIIIFIRLLSRKRKCGII